MKIYMVSLLHRATINIHGSTTTGLLAVVNQKRCQYLLACNFAKRSKFVIKSAQENKDRAKYDASL